MGRFDVRSLDDTSLAVWVDGEGPPLVMVHGALQDHTRLAPLVEALRTQVTTFAVAAMRANPLWPSRLATAPTVARELRAEDGWVYRAGQFDGVTAPTLVLAGSESPPEQQEATRQAAAAVPGAQLHVLDGHGHFAVQADPALVAGIVTRFLAS